MEKLGGIVHTLHDLRHTILCLTKNRNHDRLNGMLLTSVGVLVRIRNLSISAAPFFLYKERCQLLHTVVSADDARGHEALEKDGPLALYQRGIEDGSFRKDALQATTVQKLQVRRPGLRFKCG